jgi:uncharacterized protein (TIGR03437 family)
VVSSSASVEFPLAVKASIGGAAAEVVSVFSVPGMPQGIVQVQLRVPEKGDSGSAVPVMVSREGVASQAATLAVK